MRSLSASISLNTFTGGGVSPMLIRSTSNVRVASETQSICDRAAVHCTKHTKVKVLTKLPSTSRQCSYQEVLWHILCICILYTRIYKNTRVQTYSKIDC
jgi:hypothetical protein